jgi:hypothetical protein
VVYRALADLVVIAHSIFIVFVALGGLLVLYRSWISLVHLPAVAWAVFVEVSGAFCPLTPLENDLRRLSGSAGYSGGFAEHYLLPLIYPANLGRETQLLLAALVFLVNLAVYGLAVRHLWSRSRRLAA